MDSGYKIKISVLLNKKFNVMFNRLANVRKMLNIWTS